MPLDRPSIRAQPARFVLAIACASSLAAQDAPEGSLEHELLKISWPLTISEPAPPDLRAIWDRVHALAESFPRGEIDAYRTLGGRIIAWPELSAFAAAALVLTSLPATETELRSEASTALRRIARESGYTDLRIAAVEVLAENGDPDTLEDYVAIRAVLDGTDDPELRIACAWALWWIHNDADELVPIIQRLDAPEFRIRSRAALALGRVLWFDDRMGDHVRERVDAILRSLAREPGSRGELAKTLLQRRRPEAAGGTEAALRDEIARLRADLRARATSPDSIDDAWQQLVDLIRRRYVAPSRIRDRDLYREAVRALVESIDPHAELVDANDAASGNGGPDGYRGVGARFTKPAPDRPIVVLEPIHPGRAANLDSTEASRLRPGDRVLDVNGIDTRALSLKQFASIVQSYQSGDTIYFRRQRGHEPAQTIPIRPGAVSVPLVHAELAGPGIGYIKIGAFGRDGAAQVTSAYRALEKEAGGALASLVLDLRNNRGGLLSQAVDIADLFLRPSASPEPIVTEERLDGTVTKRYHATDRFLSDRPLAILVNRWTASSSEVLAGSLQLLGRAVLIGERTYGKGVSQDAIELPEGIALLLGGSFRIRIPTHYLLLPYGRRVQKDSDVAEGGLAPDIEVLQLIDALPRWKRDVIHRLQCSVELNDFLLRRFDELAQLEPEARWAPRAEIDALALALADEAAEPVTRDEILIAVRTQYHRYLEDRAASERVRGAGEDLQLAAALRWLGEQR